MPEIISGSRAIAGALGVSQSTVLRLIRSKTLPVFPLGRARHNITPAALSDFIRVRQFAAWGSVLRPGEPKPPEVRGVDLPEVHR